MDTNFIERRRKLLDVFVNKISLLPHIYVSLEFQAFIKSVVPFEDIAPDFKKYSYVDMSIEFQTAFPDYLMLKIPSDAEEEIHSSLQYFQYVLGSFEAFEVLCKYNVETFYEYETGMEELMKSLTDLNDFYQEYYDSKGYKIQQKDYFTNPYLILLD